MVESNSDDVGNYIDHTLTVLRQVMPERIHGDLLLLYAQLTLSKGIATTPRDVHDAWALWQSRSFPGHWSLVPFEELEPATKDLDTPFVEAIHRAAEMLAVGC